MKLDLDRITEALPGATRAEVESLAQEWSRRRPEEPSDFISWLHLRNTLPAESVRHLARSTRTPVLVGPPDPGKIGELREIGAIGRGAMGEILLARDETLHRTVAVKRLHYHAATDPDLVRRFITEAQLTAQLDHPGIVPVYSVRVPAPAGPRTEPPSYAMKLVRGRTLSSWLEDARQAAAAGPLPARQALPARLELFLSICEPMAYAHARGVIHRDLKPDNIMVGRFGEVVVMDWGMARLVGRPEAVGLDLGVPSPEMTTLGAIIGTPAYMPPEQARGDNEQLDGRADQFALGLLLYELCTLRRARGSVKGGMPMLLAATRGDIDPIVARAEPLSRELIAVIRKATAIDVANRYPDVSALADDVRHVLRGEPVLAAPDSPIQRVGRTLARQRERLVLGLVSIVAVGIGLLLSGVLGVVALREWDRQVADAATAELVAASNEAASHARALDGALSHYEGLLRSLAAASERALAACPTPDTCVMLPGAAPAVYLAGDYFDPQRAPADLVSSPIYAAPTSFLHPDLKLAPAVRLSDGYLRTLVSLRPVLLRVLLDSEPGWLGAGRSEAEKAQKIVKSGTPVVWSYVGTEAGVLVGYPGVGRYPEDYDPREQPWYKQGMSSGGPTWEQPYLDESGMGMLVSCVMPVMSPSGQKIAVAGLDLTVGYLADTWLAPSTAGAEGLLLDAGGEVLVRAGGVANAGGSRGAGGDFPWPEARAAILASPVGNIEVDGARIVWSRLSHGWTYVMAEG